MKIIDSIVDLPLYKFIDVVANGNLAALITDGLPTDEGEAIQLEVAWAKITQEYSDAIDTNEYKLYVNLLRKVSILNMKYLTLQGLLGFLSNFPFALWACIPEEERTEIREEVAGLANEINSLLSSGLVFDLDDERQYRKSLKLANSMGKGFWLKYQLQMQQLEAIRNQATSKGAPMTKEYFQMMIIILEDFSKINISDQITVYTYCERIRRFNVHQEYMSRQNQGK